MSQLNQALLLSANLLKTLSSIVLVGLILSCSSQQPIPSCGENPNTLYAKLGSQAGIEKIVDGLIQAIGRDQQIFHYFREANVSHFRAGLIQHFCDIANGPCRYQGDSMQQIHTGMNISEGDFNRLVELLIEVLEQLDYDIPIQNQLIARLAPLRSQVIKI
ncbi:MAG: group 1 truncated hemoglobin [Gammaproteobacteria bacterium]|nr:group 1 truncated hemoglobin [Gammaproteobacteria bacterium]